MQILFRTNKYGYKNEVTAIFIDKIFKSMAHLISCYSNIGQHAECSRYWVLVDTKPSTPKEYKALLAELKGIGYKDLEILNRAPRF